MGTGEFNAGGNPALDWHPIQGGVDIFLVASCHGLMDHLARMKTFNRVSESNVLLLELPQSVCCSFIQPRPLGARIERIRKTRN